MLGCHIYPTGEQLNDSWALVVFPVQLLGYSYQVVELLEWRIFIRSLNSKLKLSFSLTQGIYQPSFSTNNSRCTCYLPLMNPSLGNTKIPFFQSRSLCRNLQPLPVYFCCRPYSPGIALHLALFSQLQAPTDCEGLLKCLSSGWVLPTRNFPSFSKTPGSFWADAIWYFPSDQVFIGHFLRDCLSLKLQGRSA